MTKFLIKNIGFVFCIMLMFLDSCGREIPYRSNHRPYPDASPDDPLTADEFQAQLQNQTPAQIQADQAQASYGQQPPQYRQPQYAPQPYAPVYYQQPYYAPSPSSYQQYGAPAYGVAQSAPAPASRLYNDPYAFQPQPGQNPYGDSDSNYVAPQQYYYNPEENSGYSNYRNYKQKAGKNPVQ